MNEAAVTRYHQINKRLKDLKQDLNETDRRREKLLVERDQLEQDRHSLTLRREQSGIE